MDIVNRISVFSSRATLLYVWKDSSSLNEERLNELKKMFKAIFVAEGCDEGWREYHRVRMKTGSYPDIVMTDLKIDDSRSIKMIDKIHFENAKQTFIAISDFSERGEIESCIGLGMNYLMTKPLKREQFYSVLGRCCEEIYHRKWERRRREELEEELSALRRRCEEKEKLPQEHRGENDIPEKEDSEEMKSSLEDIAEIDFEDGLQRMGGDSELYLSLLQSFCEIYRDSVSKMKNLAESGGLDELGPVAHGVKGAAGNISAKSIYDTLVAIEKSAKEKRMDSLETLLDRYEEQFDNLCRSVQKVNTGSDSSDEEAGEDESVNMSSREDILALLAELYEMARRRKALECRNIVESLKRYTWPPDMARELGIISRAIGHYRFKEAISTMEAMNEKDIDSRQ